MASQTIKASTQKFTEIYDIVDDVVLLTGGYACLVIEVQAANFALLSKEEQDAKIFAYAALLNSLSFSIEILIRNKRVDISSYLKLLDQEMRKTQNELLATYIGLYRDFVAELVKVNTVLDKKFYIVLPFSYLEKGVAGATAMVKKDTSSAFLASAKQVLHTKADSLHSQITRLGLRARTLSKEELVKLFYDIYNRDLGDTQSSAQIETGPVIVQGKQP